jgi:hypothetical protein
MRAHLELSPAEKTAFKSLTAEEREAVVEQLIEQVREDLEWAMALEGARVLPPMPPTGLLQQVKPPPPPTVVARRAVSAPPRLPEWPSEPASHTRPGRPLLAKLR